MNPGIQREIELLKRLGEQVEVKDNEIIIHNKIVPSYIVKAFIIRIKQADTDSKYTISIK